MWGWGVGGHVIYSPGNYHYTLLHVYLLLLRDLIHLAAVAGIILLFIYIRLQTHIPNSILFDFLDVFKDD